MGRFPPWKRVVLRRFFWGHLPGTVGKIDNRNRLRLKGSPPAKVLLKDWGKLFVPLIMNPKERA